MFTRLFAATGLLSACAHGAVQPLDRQEIATSSVLPYKYAWNLRSHAVYEDCDWENEPCAKLNDVWGYEFDVDGSTHYFALVGATNGLDIVDVTDPRNPEQVAFLPGCLNNWRDYKVHGSVIYGISEHTPSCDCENVDGTWGACAEHISITAPASIAGDYPMTEGSLTPPLSESGDVSGNVWVPDNYYEDRGCVPFLVNPPEANMIALLPEGNCEYDAKVRNAQAAGCAGAIIVSDTESYIYPGMTGPAAGINITAVLIGNNTGTLLYDAVLSGATASVVLSADNKQPRPHIYGPSLTIVDMSDPFNPQYTDRRTEGRNHVDDFRFAHNVFTEMTLDGATMPSRPYMYTCGMRDTRRRESNSLADLSQGGLFVYDISDPLNPQYINQWNTTYIHDLYVQECPGYGFVLFGADINNDDVYLLDVNDPMNITTITVFPARQSAAHNVWTDERCHALYVTHETMHEPITVWEFQRDDNDMPLLDERAAYRGSLSIDQFEGTLPHNVFVTRAGHPASPDREVLWVSNYAAGVVAYDISTPGKPTLIDQLDTSNFTGGFYGVWGVYPYASSGYVYATDREEGLFVVSLADRSASSSSSSTDYYDATVALAVVNALLVVGIAYFCCVVRKKQSNTGHATLLPAGEDL